MVILVRQGQRQGQRGQKGKRVPRPKRALAKAMLYGTYKEYFRNFLDFYNQELIGDDREKLSSRKDVAEAFLAIIGDVSFTQMYETNVLKEKIADISARKQNKELFLFFKELSASHNFDISKAGDDLEAAIRGQNAKR